MAFCTFLLVTGLLGAALAGPISWDDSECSTECSSAHSKFQYESGKTYIYSYQSKTQMGMTEDDSDVIQKGTQAEIRARVEIHVKGKCEMILKLRDVSLSGTGQDLSFKNALEANPLPFGFNDGNIKELCPHPEDESRPFVLNTKRAILSALKNTMHKLDTKEQRKEVDIAGECLTKYTSSKGWSSVTVTKSKDLTSCKHRQSSPFSRFGKPYIAEYSSIHNAPLMVGKLECQQVVKNGLIENIECQERNVFSPLSRSGKGAAIETIIKMVLKDTRDGTMSKQVSISKRTSLLFSTKSLKSTAFGQEDEARQVLSEICAATRDGLKKNVPTQFAKLIAVLSEQPAENLERIHQGLNSGQICPSKIVLDAFVDSLIMAGTEGPIKFLVKLIKEEKISVIRQQAWLTSLAFNTRVDEGVIRAALPLLKEYSLGGRQALLGVSAMIHNFCSNETSDENENDCEDIPTIKEAIATLLKQLGSKCSASDKEEEHRIREILAAFENIGRIGDATDTLIQCFESSDNSAEIRHAALLAFRRAPCEEKVTKKMIQVFQNPNEQSHVRIYAYRGAMRCANKEVVRAVIETLAKEQVQQVGSFVLSHLKNMKETSSPLKQDIRKIVEDVKLNQKFPSDIRKFSQYSEMSYFSERFNAGGEVEMQLVRSEKDFIPKAAALNCTLQILGDEVNLFGVEAEMDGLTHYIESMFGPSGYLGGLSMDTIMDNLGFKKDKHSDNTIEDEDEDENKRSTRGTKDSQLARINLLHERMDAATPNDPKISAQLSLLGRKVAMLYGSDIKSLFDMKEAFSIVEILTELAKNQKVERSLSMQIMKGEFTFGAFSGLEVKLECNATAVFTFKAEGKMDIRKLFTSERSADIDGHFSPSGAVQVSATLSLNSGVHKSAIKVEASAHSSQRIEGKLEIKEGRIISMKFNLPSEKVELLSIRSDIFTVETNGQETALKPSAFHTIDSCSKSLNKPLGIEFCAHFQVPKPLYNKNAPLIPVAGPMALELSLKKTDQAMRGYTFQLELPKEHDYKEMTYKFEVDTPGSSIKRHFALEIHASRQSEDQTLNFALMSPFKKLSGTASLHTSRDLNKARLYTTIDDKDSYEVSGEVKRVVASGRTQLEPSFKIVLPRAEPITMKGSMIYTAGRKEQLVIDLQANRPVQNPCYLRGTITKEGEFSLKNLDGLLKISTDLQLSTPFVEARLHGTGDKQDAVYATDLSVTYKLPSKSQHTAKLISKVQNLSTRYLTKISTKTEATFSAYPEANTLVSWEFQHKPKEHFENDLQIMNGQNYQTEDGKFMHILQVSKMQGIEHNGRKGQTENQLLLDLPFMEDELNLQVKTDWDIISKPSFNFNADLKYKKNKHVQAALKYNFISAKPMEMEIEAKLSTPENEYIYQDKVKEKSPKEYEGKTMVQWARGKRINMEYTYKIKTDNSKIHHEVDVNLKSPFSKIPIQQNAFLRVSRDAIDIRAHTKFEGRPLYTIDAKLAATGHSKIDVVAYGVQGVLEVQNDKDSKTAKIDIKNKNNDFHYVAATEYSSDRNKKSVEIQASWNIEKDPSNQMKISASLNKASPRYTVDIRGHLGNDVNLKIFGDVEENIIRGTHDLSVDLTTPRMRPVKLTYHHEMDDDVAKCLLRYLRDNVEQLEVRTHAKIVLGKNIDVDVGVDLKSPQKSLDGKMVSVTLKHDYNSENYVANFKTQTSPTKPYTLNLDYTTDSQQRSKNKVKAHATLTTPNPKYRHQEALLTWEFSRDALRISADLTYAQSKQLKSTLQLQRTPGTALGNFKLETPFKSLKSLKLNMELDKTDAYSAKSFLEINDERQLELNSKVQYENRDSLDGMVHLQTKIGPKYDFNGHMIRSSSKKSLEMGMKREDVEVMSSKLSLEKQGKSYDGQMQLRSSDWTWIVNIKGDRKNSQDQTYTITSRGIGKPVSITLNLKRNGDEFAPALTVCPSFRGSDCLVVEGRYKKDDRSYILHREIAFKIRDQPGQEISFNYLISLKKQLYVSKAQLDIWGKELGYEAKFEGGDKNKAQVKLQLPSREMLALLEVQDADDAIKIHSEWLPDALRQPSQKLVVDILHKSKVERKVLNTQSEISIKHPDLKNDIKATVSGVFYDDASKRPVDVKAVIVYSADERENLIAEFFMENLNRKNVTVDLSLHQADRNAFELSIKGHVGSDADRLTSGAQWKLVNSGKKYELMKFSEIDFHKNIASYYIQVQKNRFEAHASWKSTPGKMFQIETDFKANEDESSAKLVVDTTKPCVDFTTYKESDTPALRYHVCIDSKSDQLFSLTAETFIENERLTDANVVIDRRDEKSFSAKFHWRPEKIGELLHHLMELSDKIESDNTFEELLKKVSRAVSSIAGVLKESVLSPLADRIEKEVVAIVNELSSDFQHIRKIAQRIYEQWPEIEKVAAPYLKVVEYALEHAIRYFEEIIPQGAKESFAQAIQSTKEHANKLCSHGSVCYNIKYAYQSKGLEGIGEYLYGFYENIPDAYYKIVVATKDLIIENVYMPSLDWEPLQKALRGIGEWANSQLEPILKSEFSQAIKAAFWESKDVIQQHYTKVKDSIVRELEERIQKILSRHEVQTVLAILKEVQQEIQKEWKKTDMPKTLEKFQSFAEEFLNPDQLANSVRTIVADPENGKIEIEIRLPKTPAEIKTWLKSSSPFAAYNDEDDDDEETLSYSDKLTKIQSSIKQEWIPPFTGHAQLIGGQHYVTFDSTFYDFAGECSYLLATDLVDKNFSVVVKYEGQANKGSGKIAKTIIVVAGRKTIEISPDEQSVQVDDQDVELPYIYGQVTIIRTGPTIVIDYKRGLSVTCHLIHDYCTTAISGWYYGKTAGLFGTYDHEPHNDFTRPRGQISPDSQTFARSWEVSTGCRFRNLAQQSEVDPEDSRFDICRRVFKDSSSPLRLAFKELKQEEYLKMCVRQVASQKSPVEAMCTVAAAFTHVSRQRGMQVSLPAECLTCKSKNHNDLDFGSKRRIPFNQVQSADVVFIVEERECNKQVVKNIDSISRLIERELNRDGISDNQYSVLAFGGAKEEQRAHSHTARGKVFYTQKDIVLATERMSFKPASRRSSADTFGAIKAAIRLPFRAGASKNFILLTCTPCDEEDMTVSYSDIQNLLLQRGIVLHTLSERNIKLRKSSSKGRAIFGLDANTVYHMKDVNQKRLEGTPDLRAQVSIPKDVCIALAQEVGGSFFNTVPVTQGSSNEAKNWKSLLARRVSATAEPHQCQDCDCDAADDVPITVCKPCRTPSPKRPTSAHWIDDEEY